MAPTRVARSAIVVVLLALIAASCTGGDGATQGPPSTLAFTDDDWEPSIVVAWNAAAVEAIRHQDKPFPTVVSRSLFIVHQAMYEAYAAMDERAIGELVPGFLVDLAEDLGDDDLAEVVSQAAYRALVDQFPEYEDETGAFSAALTELGYQPVPVGEDTPSQIGAFIADVVLRYRLGDGSEQARHYHEPDGGAGYEQYEPGPDAGYGSWEPLLVPTGAAVDDAGTPIVDPYDAATFEGQRFITPHWFLVEPYALTSADELRPAPPPYPDLDESYVDASGVETTSAQAFVDQMAEVVEIGAALTDEHKIIAEYWADGPRSESPPGHWNELAREVSIRDRHSLVDDLLMFHALNAALLDAGIATWDAKRHYDAARPVTAIPQLFDEVEGWGGPDRGTIAMAAQDWQPYQDQTFVTPAFPEYPSGHSAFSAAAAEILRAFTGSDRFADGTVLPWDHDTDGEPDQVGRFVAVAGSGRYETGPDETVVLEWPTFTAAADEAGISRLYGGIHISDSDHRGRELGRRAARAAWSKAQQLWLGLATDVTVLVRERPDLADDE